MADERGLARIHNWPDGLVQPVMVLGMEGWIDAGGGAGGAASALVSALGTETVATFDSDLLLDQRARRPVLRIENGVTTGLTWPEVELRWITNASGRSAFPRIEPLTSGIPRSTNSSPAAPCTRWSSPDWDASEAGVSTRFTGQGWPTPTRSP